MSHENDLGTWGRYQELQLDQMTAEERRTYDYTNEQRGQVPGPYKAWLQNTKLMEVMVPLAVC
jgi:4-carboxymuconolactone decarboxylase